MGGGAGTHWAAAASANKCAKRKKKVCARKAREDAEKGRDPSRSTFGAIVPVNQSLFVSRPSKLRKPIVWGWAGLGGGLGWGGGLLGGR